MVAPEHRAGAEFRVAGRTLSGTVMRYGETADLGTFRERFEPGAFAPVPAVPMRLQHDARMEILPAGGFILNDRPRDLTIRADLPADSAALRLVKRGALSGWSVGFLAREERREAGVRVVERAELVEVSLCDRGAYTGATAEVRARSGRTLRQRIPADVALRCECAAPVCKWAKIIGPAMQEMFDEVWRDTVEVLAVRSGYAGPLASKSAGTVRAEMGDGEAIVSIDLPVGPDGDAVIRAIDDTGAVIARPYFDRDRSEYDVEERAAVPAGERVAVYRRAVVRSIVVGATDARDG